MKQVFDQVYYGRYEALKPYIYAQAFHETGGFKSRLAKEQKNLFGMKKPNIRPFVGEKKPNLEYMVYRNEMESIKDLLLWMEYTNFPVTVKNSFEFVSALKSRGYFEDRFENYLAGVNNGLKEFEIA